MTRNNTVQPDAGQQYNGFSDLGAKVVRSARRKPKSYNPLASVSILPTAEREVLALFIHNLDAAGYIAQEVKEKDFSSTQGQSIFTTICDFYYNRNEERLTYKSLLAYLNDRRVKADSKEAAQIAVLETIVSLELRIAPLTKQNGTKEAQDAHKRLRFSCAFDLNDIGNGKRFAALFGHDMRYDGLLKVWRHHTGGIWGVDETGEADRRAKDVSLLVAQEAAATTDDEKRARLLKHAALLTKKSVRDTMLEDAASEWGMKVTPEKFDRDPELLNCTNGTLNLATFEFYEFNPNDLLTLQTAVRFDPEASCPTWEKIVAMWLRRPGVAEYFQDSFGASLSGKVYDEFFNLLIGPGNNGKSTALAVLEKLAGSYWIKTEAETIMRQRDGKKSEAPAPALLALKGARVVTVQEIDSKHELNAALIKDLTGRDAITARGIHAKRPTTFLPQFTLWAFGNSKPKITDPSNGMWRRVRIIEFDAVITTAQRDPDLGAKLEKELSGILNWALEGLKRVQKRGLIVPDAVNAATNTYRVQQDPLSGFLEEYCEIGPTYTESADALYAAWKEFCADRDVIPGAKNSFGTVLEKREFAGYRGNDERRRRGLQLKKHRRTVESDEGSAEVNPGNIACEEFNGESVKFDGSTVENTEEEGDEF